LDELLRAKGFGARDHIIFDGPTPAFVVLALVHAVHPGYSSLNDPRIGAIPIQVLKPTGKGSGPVDFIVTEKEDHFLIEFTCSPTFAVEELKNVIPPDVSGKGLVISGRGPNWLTVSLAMAYHAKARWVGCFQPGVGATVAMTHSDMPLGTLLQPEAAAV
jgi:CRISPR-associated Csx3 family protein